MTVYLLNIRVFNDWAKDDVIYPAVAQELIANGIGSGDVVIVRNPPGYYLASRRESISLPFGDETTILEVARKFGARYLILEKDGYFPSLNDLYDRPQDNPSFQYLGEVDGARLYRIEPAS